MDLEVSQCGPHFLSSRLSDYRHNVTNHSTLLLLLCPEESYALKLKVKAETNKANHLKSLLLQIASCQTFGHSNKKGDEHSESTQFSSSKLELLNSDHNRLIEPHLILE